MSTNIAPMPAFQNCCRPLLLILIVFALSSQSAFGQTVDNLVVVPDEDTIKISYDLMESKPNAHFRIVLRVSTDKGLTFPIIPSTAMGDVRYGIKPGRGRTIAWEPLKDKMELLGEDVVFRISGEALEVAKEPEFAKISGGMFEMGDPFQEGGLDERPQHSVRVEDFEMTIFQITNAQFARFLRLYKSDQVQDGPFEGEEMVYERPRGLRRVAESFWIPDTGYEYHPVIGVTWYGANEYCAFNGFRLPTEAEWEYAARDGGKKVRFGNGTDAAHPSRMNYDVAERGKASSSVAAARRVRTTRVTTYPPNALGLFDMSGNVWEWCQDWYHEEAYRHSKYENPKGPQLGKYKVIRGGSWFTGFSGTRASERSFMVPWEARADVGFRVVREPQQDTEKDKEPTPDAETPEEVP